MPRIHSVLKRDNIDLLHASTHGERRQNAQHRRAGPSPHCAQRAALHCNGGDGARWCASTPTATSASSASFRPYVTVVRASAAAGPPSLSQEKACGCRSRCASASERRPALAARSTSAATAVAATSAGSAGVRPSGACVANGRPSTRDHHACSRCARCAPVAAAPCGQWGGRGVPGGVGRQSRVGRGDSCVSHPVRCHVELLGSLPPRRLRLGVQLAGAWRLQQRGELGAWARRVAASGTWGCSL